MEFLVLAISFPNPLAAIYVGLGLGLVIFIHELGHFAVAKWCGVKVERFSIGFGPILWKFTRGDTEYALSAIPFGGYVKMLGQDDADPSQLTDNQIARDPRSYTSKTVLQRMAIISAGVINNMVTAVLFFVLAFQFGVEYTPAVIGQAIPGKPAWEAGLRGGDVLTQVGNRKDSPLSFVDVRQVVALTSANESVHIKGLRDGREFSVDVKPAAGEYFYSIGISMDASLKLVAPEEPDGRVTQLGTSANAAKPAFESEDTIVALDGQKVETFSQFQVALAKKRDQAVTISVRRKGAAPDAPPVDLHVEKNPFRSLGLVMDIGKISAIQANSPASLKGLRVGDKLTHVIVDGKERPIGTDLDPMQLPDYFASLHGKPIKIRVNREVPNAGVSPEVIELTPDNRPGWIERPQGWIDGASDLPLPVPAIGVAFHVLHHVVKVDPKGPAAGKIQDNDNISKIEFFLPEGEKDGILKFDPYTFGDESRNWPEAFWAMQTSGRMRRVRMEVQSQGAPDKRIVELIPQEDPNWFMPTRGIIVQHLSQIRKAASLGEAISLGLRHTRTSVVDMWLTIRSLFSGRISPKSLGGPLQIGAVAYDFAKKGLSDLSLFLGLLSVSLAVLNFMPIPVLDGGHFVFLCWEGIRGKPPSERIVIAANYVGLSLVLSLMCWVLGLDIYRLFLR